MATFKKKDLTELVGGDISAGGNDKATTNNSEIETGPVQKPYNDKSDYEKAQSTTTDRVFGRYRQNIPWFAVYAYGGARSVGGLNVRETFTKQSVEEKIDDLVKKSKSADVTDKNYNPKVSKVMDTINDVEMTEKQLEELEQAIKNKRAQKDKAKNL